MFDANMSHIRKGEMFFAKVHSIEKCSELYVAGVRAGQLLKCKMASEGHDNPAVHFYLPSGELTVRSRALGTWIVYEGNYNIGEQTFKESDFIDKQSFDVAKSLLINLEKKAV